MSASWTLGVVGAGVMGGEIAQLGAQADIPTVLVDVDERALARGLDAIRARLGRLRDRVAPDLDVDATVARVTPSRDLAALRDCRLVIEAAPERMDVKLPLFAELARVTASGAVLASNTSALPISQMAAAAVDPSRVLGLHFFNPATRMPLVEVIRTGATSDGALAAGTEAARQLGKTPVQVRESPGFLVNRVLVRAIAEAIRLASEDRAAPADVDAGVRASGPAPMGPFELADLIGLDTFEAIRAHLEANLGRRFSDAGATARLVAAGRLGRKLGGGFRDHSPDGAPGADAGRAAERYYLAAADEARMCVDQAIAGEADVDLALRLGAGWIVGPLEQAGGRPA